MLDFNTDHKALVITAFSVFLLLSIGIAVIPAFQMQDYEPLPNQPKMTAQELEGQRVYIAEGCVACHTQQVRNIEMDNMWGKRPSVPEDYYYNKQRMDIWRATPSVLGSERTGPDLTDIGNRQPGAAWHYLHFYNPRIVVEESIMPAFKWLFTEKDSAKITDADVVVPVSKEFFNKPGVKIVATQKAQDLVAYMQFLKQPELPKGVEVKFIPLKKVKETDKKIVGEPSAPSSSLDGEKLFMSTCAACHQSTGKGVAGAFPPLAGSDIVNNEDPSKMISIILMGYHEKEGYGPMPPFGDQLTDAEIAAIMTHERTSWGNTGSPVEVEAVKKVRDSLLKNR
ncbi:c-type cytochrome [Aequorivita sp. H23M31]|uniref:C-type cytochrome n=1 Tax=Aequorivita ciconiae TaxID=2494375 RepID=A0A410G1V6_9FLAO|nr:cbb3-type cytochrome c oxidase subunit II [Aequorivita sp. H23M31]QAA81256.1 c-type cytochrome [Aequorivita sp. H23M31]